MNHQQQQYGVDIRYVIDATMSMAPILDLVKREALGFAPKLRTALTTKGKQVHRLRLGADIFRDVYCDGADAFAQSPFFDMASDEAAFGAFMNAVRPINGGDEPESGLEALALALHAPWSADMGKLRHVIVLYTDASAHPLEKAVNAATMSNYPHGIPNTFDALTDLWSGQAMHGDAKRLILFAPDAYPWTDIATHWENTVHYPSRAGCGLSELDAQTILDAIVNSIATR